MHLKRKPTISSSSAVSNNPMATPSSLISLIQSVVHSDPFALEINIRLRNIKVRLVCLRNLGDDDKHEMQSLFSRIQDVIIGGLSSYDDLRAVNCLAKEMDGECPWCIDAIPNHLTLDDAVEVVDSLVDNIPDFRFLVKFYLKQVQIHKNLRDAIDEVEVLMRFLRDFLLYAKRAGAHEIHHIQDLLNLIRPFIWGVACAFQTIFDDFPCPLYDEDWVEEDWAEEVKSSFPQDSLHVFQFCTQALLCMSTLDQIDDSVLKDFLSSLISLFWHLLRYHCHHPRHSVNLRALYGCLRLSRFILKQQRQTNNSDFEDQIGVLIRDAGILICSLHLTDVDPQSLTDLLQRFDVVKAQVPHESNSLETNALNLGDSTSMEAISDGILQIETDLTSLKISSTPRDAGFQEDEVDSVLDRLLRGSKELRLVPITGMPGLGKTTFALKIYDLPKVIYGFQARAWCTISQVLDKKKVLVRLLDQIQPGDYSGMTEDDLANKLRRSLKGKRYLILLDDVWSPQAWESLRPSFPDDATGSRIVFTSRLDAIVPHARHDEQPHFLRLRSENECLEIMEMKLSHSARLRIEPEKFAKLCKGLPLTVVLVAGLLSATVPKGWEGILDNLSLGGISDVEQCNIALELSYKQLPDYLKPCFIYFGAFPEDEQICAKNLIRLWMAEGFVARGKELFAGGYLDDLIQRNLVMVVTKRSTGGIKTCRVHDLLHDFCLIKGKQEHLFHLLLESREELSNFNEPCNLERLSIHSSILHFKDSGLFCPRARSMLLFTPKGDITRDLLDIEFIIQIYKHLRVLYADWVWCETPIPSEIELLTHLTYLSIGCRKPVIPSSIGNLTNLETLIIRHIESGEVLLPHTIWNLQKLKYLRISRSFRLPIQDLENFPNLLELESIRGVEFFSYRSMKKQMRKFPNIIRLKCSIRGNWKIKTVVIPEFLSKLKFLTLRTKDELQYQFDFGFAENLRKLTLKKFVLSREEIAVIGKLPNLEVLKLLEIVFLEGKMEMEEGEFSKLRSLVFGWIERSFSSCILEMWTAAGDEPLPCLEKLAFSGCSKLKEIPCLETSYTLEEILVYDCSSALESLVRNIEAVQNDYGNSIRVQIMSSVNGFCSDDDDEEEEEVDESESEEEG